MKSNDTKIHRGFTRRYARFINKFSKLSYLLFSGGGDFTAMILGIAGLKKNDRIMDIGCGVGHMLIEIEKSARSRQSPCFSVGIDRSPAMIEFAAEKLRKENVRGSLVVCDALSLPFKAGALDVVFNILILHHLPPQMKIRVLNEMARVLKAGGKGVLVDVDRPSSLLGRLIVFSRRHVYTIRTNCDLGLEYYFSRAGFRAKKQIKKMGIFSYYLLEKQDQ